MNLGGKEPATHLRALHPGKADAASVTANVVNLPGSFLDDPAVAMHILGHEEGHIIYKKIGAIAADGKHPKQAQALRLLETVERAAGMGPYRDPSGVMGPAVAAAKQRTPGSSIPDIQNIAKYSKKSMAAVKKKAGTGRPHGSPVPATRDLPAYKDPKLTHDFDPEFAAGGRMGERAADLLSGGVSQRGQQNWTPAQLWEMSHIMKPY
jgi:hypothetical protein